MAALTDTDAERPVLGAFERIAILLGRNHKVKPGAMSQYFRVSERHIYRVIHETRESMQEVWQGIQCFNELIRKHPQDTKRRHKDCGTQTDLAEDDCGFVQDCAEEQTPVSAASNTCSLRRTITKLQKEKKSLGIQLARVQYLLRREKFRAEAVTEETDLAEGSESEEIDDSSDDLFHELVRLHQQNKYSRRYSEELFRFAYIFLSYSPRAFHFVRQRIPLPSKSRLYTKFGPFIKQMKSNLTDINGAHNLLDNLVRSRFNGTPIVCTLGVDAFAFRLFLRSEVTRQHLKCELSLSDLRQIGPLLEDKTILDELFDEEEDLIDEMDSQLTKEKLEEMFACFNYCFIFVLQPLNSHIPCLTLHLLPAGSGVATEQIMDTVDELIDACKQHKVEIRYVSADGDKGWNCRFHSIFKLMESVNFTTLDEFSLDVFKKCEEAGIPLAVTDLLHCVKAARGRYIDHKMLIATGHKKSKTKYKKVCRVLPNCSRSLTDKTQMGRMRDFYPLDLFTTGNVLRLLHHQLYPDAFYFVSYTLLLLVIRVPFFRMDFRLQLLSVAYGLFSHVYKDIVTMTEKPKDQRVPQRYFAECKYITFAEVATIERILCTMASYASAFQLHTDDLRTDALGTHIVEQRIGQSRQGSDSRWERILSLFAQGAIRSLFLEEDDLKPYIHGRLKNAGCRLDGRGDVFIEEFNPTLFCRVFINSLTKAGRTPKEFLGSLGQVTCWLSELDEVLTKRRDEIGKMWLPSPAANCSITARLIKSSLADYGLHPKE